MSKGPPPAIKPKPKNLQPALVQKADISCGNHELKSGVYDEGNGNTSDGNTEAHSSNGRSHSFLKTDIRRFGNNSGISRPTKTVIDSVVSKPVTMTIGSDLSSDEDDDGDAADNEPASNLSDNSGAKSSVYKSYPLPPKRNQFAVATAIASPLRSRSGLNDSSFSSPLRNKGIQIDDQSYGYAEGMRSPLKKDTVPAPPPRRNMTKTRSEQSGSYGSKSSNHDQDTNTDADADADAASGQLNGGKLPSKVPRPSRRNLPPKPKQALTNLKSFASEDESTKPSLPPRRAYRPKDEGESESESEISLGMEYSRRNRSGSLRAESSEFFNTVKNLSRESFNVAKEKSIPLAKDAMEKFSKMKHDFKNGLDTGYRDDLNNDNERYTRSRNMSEDDSELDLKRSSLSPPDFTQNEDFDISIDEDRPPLPLRPDTNKVNPSRDTIEKAKRPLMPNKPKPAIPNKPKPVIAKSSSPCESDAAMKMKEKLSPPPPPSSRIRSNSSSSSLRSNISSNSAALRSTKAPAAPPPRIGLSSASSWKEPVIDLELNTRWFLNDDVANMPVSLKGLTYQLSYGVMGSKQFKIFAFRMNDLSTCRLKLLWDKNCSDVLKTITSELSFLPPPVATKSLLLQGSSKYGEHIANWCEFKEGECVGNGECWTLAHDALEKSCGKHAFVSTGLNHGACISIFKGMGDNNLPKIISPNVTDDIKRGDIVQFKSCILKYSNRIIKMGAPDHTAVVLNVKNSEDVNTESNYKWLEIVHQNLNGVKKVRITDIDLSKLVEGELRVYRAVDANWIKDLSEVVL